MRATCPSRAIILDYIALTTFGEEHILWTCIVALLLCLFLVLYHLPYAQLLLWNNVFWRRRFGTQCHHQAITFFSLVTKCTAIVYIEHTKISYNIVRWIHLHIIITNCFVVHFFYFICYVTVCFIYIILLYVHICIWSYFKFIYKNGSICYIYTCSYCTSQKKLCRW
jgi:hypothetical protein